ncbi:DUF86 domain-containing protein [soil metagenome]
MTRETSERFDDILNAIERSLEYRARLADTDPSIASMAFDAILRNLAVIGEAVRTLPTNATAFAPEIPWASISGLRNIVIHEYFRIEPHLIQDIVDNELVPLADAIRRSNTIE